MQVKVKRVPGTEHMLRLEVLLDREEYVDLTEAIAHAATAKGRDKALVGLLDKLPFLSELP